MTQNQINYQKSLEEKRANQAREALTQAQNEETHRANTARESETNRSNLANELLKSRDINAQYAAKVYAADKSAEASGYSADRRYQGSIDSAYIREYGIDPSTVKDAAAKVGEILTSPQAVRATTGLVAAPIVAYKVLQNAPRAARSALTNTFTQLRRN